MVIQGCTIKYYQPWDKIFHMAPIQLGNWDNLQHTRAGYLGLLRG